MMIRKIGITLIICVLMSLSGVAQTSNWVINGPVAFPPNLTGQINGIGRVCQIKYSPLNPNSIFACSASGGLWKSTNQGNSWFVLNTDKLPSMSMASVCIDFTDSNIIYLASGDPNYYSADLGIWKTTNGGQNWLQANTGIGNRMAVEMLMDPANHLVLIAATNDGIWKTTDGGNTWTQKLVGNSFTDMMWQPLTGSSVMYASSMNKYFRSTDKGETWTEITAGFTNLLASGTRLAVSAANPAIVYVGTVNDEGTIFKSVDTGKTFTIQYHNPSWSLTGYDSTGGGQGNYNFCIEASPTNPDQLFLGSHNVMRSNDGGVTWSKLTNWWKTVHTDMHDWAYQPGNSTKLFQANDGGVWLTQNEGVDWIQTSEGLSATENYNAAVSPLYAGLMSSGTQDNGELVRIDNAWKTNRGGDWTTKMQMDYSPQKFVYYFSDLERRSLPSGGGNTYNLPASVTSSAIKHAFSPDNQDLAFVSSNGIWRTQNLTQSYPVWTQIVSANVTVRSMAVCQHYPHLLAYTVSGKIYISHNATSASPTFVDYSLPVSGTNNSIYISSQDTNLIYVTINTKVYRSTNGGVTFADYTGTLAASNHFAIYLDDFSANESVYVGNATGIYYRNKTLPDWVNYSGALPTIASIRNFLYFNDGGSDARIYVSYYGRGLWESTLENSHTCQTPTITSSAWNGNQFVIQWNATGASQYQIQYRELGTLTWNSQTSTTPSISISNYSGCTSYEARVKGLCASDSSLWSSRVFFQTPTNPLNNDFDNHQDIGPVGAAGSVCYDAVNSRYTILASGEDIWDKNDEFHFLYKKMHGDLTISARVRHVGNIYGWAKAGVMIRETLATDSKHAICALTPGNGFAMQWRENTNDWSSSKDTAGNAPGWVKLERIGSNMNSYFSTDGTTWNLLNSATIAMQDTVYLGLANCSHIDSTLNDAIFDQIVINGKALHVNEISSTNTPLMMYPNPAHEELTIRFNEAQTNAQATVHVIDLSSKVVLTQKLTIQQNEIKMPMTSLANGHYIVEVRADKVYRTHIVKQ